MGDHTESEEDIKIDIKEASIDLIYIKEEPKEEIIDLDENCHAGTSGESSVKKELEVYGDDLLDPLDTDIIMENEFVKLEDIKGESRSFETFHCNKCNKIYKGYCIKCSTLSRILNKIPTDILEIRDTSMGKGVFLLKPLPKNIIFGPFEGVPPIESTKGYSWKIKDKKLVNIDNGSWIKDITSAVNALIRNLDIFQFDGKLYLETIREVVEGDELLIYYNDEEIQASDNSEECYFIPQKRDELPKAFACTLCCYGFSSDECLVEHKSKCPHAEQNADVEDFELTECACCKIWLEKQEYQDYHMAYCWRKNQRMSADHEKSLVKNEMSEEKMNQDETDVTEFCNVELKESNCGTTTESPKKNAEYQCVMCSETFDGEDNLRLHMEAEHAKETEKYSTLIEEYPEWFYETNNTSHLPNMDNDIKQVECDICMAKFSRKSNLTRHLKRKHPENTSEDKYKCSESGCLFQTNFKLPFQVHLKKHHGIKPFECDICKKKFSEKVNMLRHRIIHSDVGPDKEYKCPECSYQTNYKERLALHLNNHNPVKAFACDICTEKFTQRRNLQAHVKNKHSTVRKYKCPDCSYQSNNSSNFKLHLNMHNEVKPFECDICKKKFASKYSLKVHKKDKHAENGTEKKYKCTKTGCSYQTYFKQSLTLHVNKHNKIKPFDCNICKKKFTQKRHLNVHIKNKHSENTTKAK